MEIIVKIEGTVNVDCGKGIMRVIELGKIHPNYIESLFTKRLLRDRLQDTHASVTLDSVKGDEAEQRRLSAIEVDKYILALYEGTARQRGERRAISSDPMSSYRIAALRSQLPKETWAKINKRDDKVEFIKSLLDKNAEKLEPLALELKAIDDEKARKMEALGAGLDMGGLEI